MLMYVVRRLLQAIPVFLGTTFLIYFMVFSMPGDPVLALFGDKTPNPAVLEAVRAQYNLDQPFFVQYLLYLKNLLTGNLGVTFSGQEVSEVFARAFPVTLKLVVMAVVIEFLLAVIIGLISGLRKGGIIDNTNLVVALVLSSVPPFVALFLAQYFIGIKLGWAPVTVGANATWGAMFLPALVIALTIYVTGMRLMRGSVIEAQNADYVRTASAKGLTRGRIVGVHVARNSLIPVITNTAASFGALIAGTTVTEGIFNIPGIGKVLFDAITRGENATVVTFVTILTIMYVIVNILVDLLYAVLDPRIRYV
ncbi:ABC transporter permease [Demequina lignilytica]|uniref:ABC transporter permease n=1 Tax=Demequina lignilytica TaxID=3051663 RepID=A0AAW7M2V9_9MICO|nr:MULTISPECIES: ABC transporter permease [unclassified Demequina]MDN4477640.1 ABC transporter permease [Demequina sp. SYSU T00039-1]MDN4483684.1 ABC transporter permease [Demequina sp. SYSU T0a273]MDN4488009.1 ABC transporter permease [Demequina sp. SYSU T00039]MDN4490449.1 ABC transporter permease [Demequina sp. SYSU T00068]